MRIGFFAFFSIKKSIARVISDRTSTSRKGVDVQPKFCPKEGMHSKRPKKAMTKKAPARSKFFNGFRAKDSFGSVKTHSNKNTTHIAEDIHISVRQLPYSKISPPRVGPKITATLESSI